MRNLSVHLVGVPMALYTCRRIHRESMYSGGNEMMQSGAIETDQGIQGEFTAGVFELSHCRGLIFVGEGRDNG